MRHASLGGAAASAVLALGLVMTPAAAMAEDQLAVGRNVFNGNCGGLQLHPSQPQKTPAGASARAAC